MSRCNEDCQDPPGYFDKNRACRGGLLILAARVLLRHFQAHRSSSPDDVRLPSLNEESCNSRTQDVHRCDIHTRYDPTATALRRSDHRRTDYSGGDAAVVVTRPVPGQSARPALLLLGHVPRARSCGNRRGSSYSCSGIPPLSPRHGSGWRPQPHASPQALPAAGDQISRPQRALAGRVRRLSSPAP
jgi:hypothetical protein